MTKTPSPAQRLTRLDRSPASIWDPQHNVVWLRGEQNSATVPELCASVARAIAFDEADLLFDLSNVTSIDKTVVEVIALTREYLRQRSRSLALRSSTPSISRVFVRCGHAELISATQEFYVSGARSYRPSQSMASIA